MSTIGSPEPREVELIFDDPTPTGRPSAGSASSAGNSTLDSRDHVHFTQRSTPGTNEQTAPQPTTTQAGTASYTSGNVGREYSGNSIPTARLSETQLPSLQILGVTLLVALILNMLLAFTSLIPAIAGITAPLNTMLASTSALVATGLVSTLVAIAITFATWSYLRKRAENGRATAFVFITWLSWLLSGIFASASTGSLPFVVSAVAFCVSFTTTVHHMNNSTTRGITRWWEWVASAVSLIVIITAVLTGTATLASAIITSIISTAVTLMSIRAWNAFVAPIIDTREHVRSMMNVMRGAGF